MSDIQQVLVLYKCALTLTEIKNAEHMALKHDPVQQLASERAFTTAIDVLTKTALEIVNEEKA